MTLESVAVTACIIDLAIIVAVTIMGLAQINLIQRLQGRVEALEKERKGQ